MEPFENNKNEVLRQMEKYNFDEPLKIAVILEELEEEEYRVSEQDSINEYIDINSNAVNNGCNSSFSKNVLPCIRNTSDIDCNKNAVEDNNYTSYRTSYENQQLLHPSISNMNERELPVFKNNTHTDDRIQFLRSLDILSENLILITQYGFQTTYYVHDQILYNKAKKKYLSMKIEIFKASFNITTDIILPKRNNPKFLERFINGTVQIAKSKSLYSVSKEIIECLTIDLIKWTKFEIGNLKTGLNKKNPLEPHVLPVENENETFNSSTHKRRNVCIFSVGPPEKRWSINIDSQILSQNQKVSNSNPENFTSEYTSISPKRLKLHDQVSHPQLNSHCSRGVNHDQLRLSPQNPNVGTTVSPESKDNLQEFWNELRSNVCNNDVTRLMLRSVSRDSGNESPTSSNWQTNIETETMLENVTTANTENINITPHMTSRNSINHITCFLPDGKHNYCTICQKPSYDKCRGCERQYYCSNECQNKDWAVHKHLCRRLEMPIVL